MRALTKADKDRGKKLRDLGCIVCLLYLEETTPPEIHHLDGKTKPGCHQKTIGLCNPHHRTKCNQKYAIWVSRHGDGRFAFEERYDTEQYLLDETNRLINET